MPVSEDDENDDPAPGSDQEQGVPVVAVGCGGEVLPDEAHLSRCVPQAAASVEVDSVEADTSHCLRALSSLLGWQVTRARRSPRWGEHPGASPCQLDYWLRALLKRAANSLVIQ